jgi:hypothetical protein
MGAKWFNAENRFSMERGQGQVGTCIPFSIWYGGSMKTSIKLTREKSVTVVPTASGHILIGMDSYLGLLDSLSWQGFAELTPDQASVLIFAIEQALNAIDLSHRKELENIRAQGYADKYSAKDIGTRCHGDACAAGQLPCPTRAACGVAA